MGANNNPRITKEQMREEWENARGIKSRKEFEAHIGKKYNLLPNSVRKYLCIWKIYSLNDVNFTNTTPKEKRPGYHGPKEEVEEENKEFKEEANPDQKIESKKPIEKKEKLKELGENEPTEKLINTVQDIIDAIPSKPLINYTDIALEIGGLVQTKNVQYGNAINDTEEFLNILYPNGIDPENYKNIGAIIRVFDKLKRIANGNQGEENAWQDIAGYGILMCGSEE